MKHNMAKLQLRWAVRWALVWVDMWLVVVIAGCLPQNGSEDGAPGAASTMAQEDTARDSTQVQPWLRRRREEWITYD
jgi:hypothetical protein